MSTVFVGLSGGVDSAVAALLLKQRGHEVTGVFIKIWSPEFLECTWRDDRLDAMRVCVALGIPFREIDLSAEYRAEVVDGMVHDYAMGSTPNPDVLCNEKIKFGHFAQWAFAQGAEYIATGHYARIDTEMGRVRLLRGVDSAKDQSYFLCRVGHEVLARTLLPIGAYPKSEVRALARAAGLPVASKPDSQGLCFVGEVTMQEFLSRFVTFVPGVVEDSNGAAIGEHQGAALYTRGQRYGFVVHGERGRAAHYVIATDVMRNVIRVSTDRNDAAVLQVPIADLIWITDVPTVPTVCEVQTRYHDALVTATISENIATFERPHAATPGQSLVMYHGEECIGSARICV